MKWFPGSITDAVTTAKQRKAIFVVFVEGKDEFSIMAARVLDEDKISSRMDRDDFVAVRVEADTESYTFFKQIYRFVPVPSLFFIGTNGALTHVVAGSESPESWSSKIDSALTDLKEAKGSPSDSSSSLIKSEQSAGESVEAGPSSAPTSSQASVEGMVEPSAEEKLERAKQLIELQRQQKMEKEREEEKKREIERRQLGKDLQQLKQKQQDVEMKLALEERMKEKAAEAEARERVLRQIAQDKLERKQREMALQQQNAAQMQSNFQEERPSSSGSSSSDTSVARIQFRLPAGNPHTGKFDSTSTLGSLRSYVAANIELPFQDFTMSTTFPRRDLTVEDDGKTLRELELVPTAVILILPVKNSKISSVVSASDNVGFVSRFIWALFAPILSIYNFVMGYFTGGPANPPERPRASEASSRNENPERIRRISGQASGGSINRNLLGGPTTTIRSRGNIHRLHSGGDDNDENNTWNGNSTQQM